MGKAQCKGTLIEVLRVLIIQCQHLGIIRGDVDVWLLETRVLYLEDGLLLIEVTLLLKHDIICGHDQNTLTTFPLVHHLHPVIWIVNSHLEFGTSAAQDVLECLSHRGLQSNRSKLSCRLAPPLITLIDRVDFSLDLAPDILGG